VLAWSFDHTMARMTSDPASLDMKGGKGGVFHYEVISVKNDPKPEVIIHVTQREELGVKKPDARVVSLQLLMNDSMNQSAKTYLIKDSQGVAKRIPVSPDGIRSSITPLELFPLDVPELITAESKEASSMPELPVGLKPLATQAGFSTSPDHGLWFEQDDFFGRPIQALWKQGDPWPAYYRTSNGVSLLIRKGAS
jgi:hypothetical protein